MTITETAPPAAPEAPVTSGEGDGGVDAPAPPTSTGNRKKKIAALVALGVALLIVAALLIWLLLFHKPPSQLPGLSQAGVPHYQSSIYGVNHPVGVAASPSGDRVYVTENDGQRLVKIFDRSGKPGGILKPPVSTGATHIPVYVAVNPVSKDVYVSDRATSSVYIYSESGTYLRTFAPRGDLGGGWAPMGLAFGPDGSLYATDVSGKAHRALVFSPDGTLVRTLGTPGQMSFPNGIVVDPRGNVEVSDSNNGRVVVFDPAGKVLATVNQGVGDGDLGRPTGMAIDDASRLFAEDNMDHEVRVYDVGDSEAATPKYIGSFGTLGQADGMFQYPNGVATDRRAQVYITDRDNNRVQVWGY